MNGSDDEPQLARYGISAQFQLLFPVVDDAAHDQSWPREERVVALRRSWESLFTQVVTTVAMQQRVYVTVPEVSVQILPYLGISEISGVEQ